MNTNNREIKFRAWNGEKILFYNNWFTLERQDVLCFEKNEEHTYVDNSDVDFPKRVKLMQYTGLKDKKGIEIFEGDIVRIKGLGEGVIVFDEKKARFMWNDNSNENWGIENDDKFNEVIGNIYENPKL